MSAPPIESDDTSRRRYRWPWRGCGLVAGWIVILLVVRFAWDGYARLELQRVLGAARAAGQLLEAADIDAQPLRDSANGAYWLGRAIKNVQAVNPSRRTPQVAVYPVDFLDLAKQSWLGYALSDAHRERFRQAAPALLAVRAARACDDRAWPVKYTVPMNWWLAPFAEESRDLARLVVGAALICALDGESAQAVELLRDALAIAEHTRDPRLTAAGIYHAEFIDTLTVVGIGRTFELVRLGEGGASRVQVEALITTLLDPTPVERGWRTAVLCEALSARDTTLAAADLAPVGPLAGLMATTPPVSWAISPGFRLDAARQQREVDAALDPRADRSPSVSGLLYESHADLPPVARLTRLGARLHSGWFDESPNPRELRAWREAGACLLAIRLYAADNGTLPVQLDELVPAYLPAVPRDPFDPDGLPIRYRLEPAPHLYSVGENGVDEGGQERFGRQRNARDDVFWLSGSRRLTTRLNAPIGPLAAAETPPGLAQYFPPADLTPDAARTLLLEAPVDNHQEVNPRREQQQHNE